MREEGEKPMVNLAGRRGGSLLKCADLKRREHLVQIESIADEDVGEERKLVARFVGKTKGLVLNDTNLEFLETAFGPDSDDAIGGQAVLHVDPDVRYGGQKVGGIRMKLPKMVNAKEKAAAKPATADLIDDDSQEDWKSLLEPGHVHKRASAFS
jgi:hypothetical protein